MSLRRRWAAIALLLAAVPARAHHGTAAGGFIGEEGPGAAIETTSALPLPARTLLFLGKEEYSRFRRYERAEPVNKAHFSFTTLGAGVGLLPWLSAYAFAPYAAKAQDTLGTSAGLGDPSLLAAVGLKWDEGLRLVPEKESLDELRDWHFSLWASGSAPLGSVARRDARGEPFEPEMQTGFGAPSGTLGAAVLKQVGTRLTFLADASHQRFLPHTYGDGARHEFGAETRVNAAAAWRVMARPRFRLDVLGELNGLRLARDRERAPGAASLEPLRASGGDVLYAALGARAHLGRLAIALGVKRAALTRLHEASEQQGSEGLEAYRATAVVSWAAGL
ncbi:MAG TPA: hypothetical protein VFK90_10870 [Anaeromyxobacter sp.]|nr:hypothetical protein [Anaeromyxobacter sp.]